MFEDNASAKNKIQRDKHTVLEGYVTEELFRKQFLSVSSDAYTRGWWSAVANGQRFFFLVSEQKNDVDCKVMLRISGSYPCWRVYKNGKNWRFRSGDTVLDFPHFLKRYQIKKIARPASTCEEVKNKDRQERCLNYFEHNNMLRNIAVERDFANFVLSSFFQYAVNIDFFAISDEQLCAIEVKYKYGMPSGEFGMNVGQYQFLKEMNLLGFEIYNILLWNSTGNKNLSVFDFLDQPDIEKKWLCNHMEEFPDREVHTAPSKTEVYGRNGQKFHKLDRHEFKYEIPFLE